MPSCVFIKRASRRPPNWVCVGVLNPVPWRQYGSAFDIADDGPPTLIDVNMLDADKLLPAMTQPAKNLYLHRERLH